MGKEREGKEIERGERKGVVLGKRNLMKKEGEERKAMKQLKVTINF